MNVRVVYLADSQRCKLNLRLNIMIKMFGKITGMRFC